MLSKDYLKISIFLVIIFYVTHSHRSRSYSEYRRMIRKRAAISANDSGKKDSKDDKIKCVAATGSLEPGTARIELCNVRNYYYLGHISIGVPPQTVWMEFDTGSSTTWVMTNACYSTACRVSSRFNPRRSLTFDVIEETFNFTYGAGDSVSGIHAVDHLCIGKVCVANQSFGAALKVYQDNTIADGIVGLAYPILSVLGQPLVSSLGPKLRNSVFAVNLRRDAFSVSQGGQITFGYINKTLQASEFLYVPVVNQSYWSLEMESVMVLDPLNKTYKRVACQAGCAAIIDTATSYILGAHNETAALLEEWAKLGHVVRDPVRRDYFTDCQKMAHLPTLAFVLNGHHFELTPNDYTFPDKASDPCLKRQVALEGDMADLDFWVLGGAFLGPFYTVFDFAKNRVGIAKAAKLA